MTAWRRALRHTGSATAEQISSVNIHAYVGIAILVIVALRLLLRTVQGVPTPPSDEPAILRWVAKLTHAALLYLLLIALPLTGAAAYYFSYDGLGGVHADILKVILWMLISGHVLGALVHQFYWKTNILRRMTVG